MLKGIILFVIANVLAWFQFNSQFVWGWFEDRPIITCAVFAFPMSIVFWYAINSIMLETGQLWTTKLVGFGVGNIVFGILTWLMLGESLATAKAIICLSLASMIIGIQIFWK
jgi:hypothetical protein|tara:strand:+ start:3515 stop:3850 length:336 start_codon:yes stop_codon:yes gene_type:complete